MGLIAKVRGHAIGPSPYVSRKYPAVLVVFCLGNLTENNSFRNYGDSFQNSRRSYGTIKDVRFGLYVSLPIGPGTTPLCGPGADPMVARLCWKALHSCGYGRTAPFPEALKLPTHKVLARAF